MPHLQVNGANIYYEDSDPNNTEKEVIVFSHGLLWSTHLFDKQVAHLKDRYRCIAYDLRGQGKTEVTAGGYDMDTLYEDAAALIKALNIAPCHFAGLSMGGFIAMRLAARQPDLIRSIILMETTADPEPAENIPKYRRLNIIARWLSMRLAAEPVMQIMFGQKFLNDPARIDERNFWKQQALNNHRVGITRAVVGVIERKPVYDEIAKITVPTLIMVGDQDVATVPAKSERIHQQISGSKLVIIPGAGHTSAVEEADFINAQIDAFLAGT